MYSESDPVAEYYDFSLAKGPPDEIAYYTEIARTVNGPCLDLCCGTGILSIIIAGLGVKVYSVDNSASMMGKFKAKLEGQLPVIQNRITLVQNPMTRFALTEPVNAVICRDAFFHNLTPSEERETLLCIHRQMAPDGIFAFNIHNPNPQFLLWALSEESSRFKDRQTYDIPGTRNTLTIQEALEADLDKQTILTRLKFLTKAEDGSVIKKEESSWLSRYIYPYEMFYLLELCGFSIRAVYGNYKGESYHPDSMLVIEAKKTGRLGGSA
jgi:SAM-dependent methyltransferase